jgi:hypothetical protein
MPLSPWRFFLEILKSSWPAALGLSLLATLPPEILNQAMGWNLLDPGTALGEAAWLPATALCQLLLLKRLGRLLNSQAGTPAVLGGTLLSAIGCEFLLALRFCKVVLLWALPALFVLAAFGLERLTARLAVAALALGAAVPCLLYLLQRVFSAPIVLWQGLKASQALDESARLSSGRLKSVLWPLVLFNGIGLILEGISGDSLAVSALVLPLSFLLSNTALAWSYRRLTL